MERWAAVNRNLIRREHRAGIIEAHYTGADAVRSELTALVSAERDCCAHLGWELADAGDVLTLRIRGTEEELDAFEA